MATHDYSLANQDGASFRSDLNNALAAIVSNNSSSTAPSTTFAHQIWVDTTANVIKQRNAANDAWIELWRIDGGFNAKTFSSNVTLNAQSDLRFADSDSSNWVAFQAPATVASNVTWTLPSADGTADQALTTNGSGVLSWADAGGVQDNITEGNTSAEVVDTGSDGHFKVVTEGTEAIRVDNSRRLLVGTSSSRSIDGLSAAIQCEGTVGSTAAHSAYRTSNDQYGAYFLFGKSRSTSLGGSALVSSGDEIGILTFCGADGTDTNSIAARIGAYVDGTPGSNDMPGRLVFSTTADGASSPTEQLRITSDRYVRLASGSGGIQFNGDTAATNALDDYEEGTWTPIIKSGSNTISVSGGNPRYTYTKIGNQVTVYYVLDGGVTTSGTTGGSFRIEGLPFSSASTLRTVGPPCFFFDSGLRAADWPIFPHVSQSGSTVNMYYKASATSGYLTSNVASVGNSYVFFQLTYTVS